MIEMLKSKIHRATITDADIQYEGSITISADLIEQADIREYEKVLVVDVNNGARFETYVIQTDKPGVICVNGAAARLVSIGDKVIIMSFCFCEEILQKDYRPRVVILDERNCVKK
ncbi:MAG: aspartate 1-decarboxylase [Clostridiales bacterium]|jgi:aspartate 1-decarboxylase|nr:aspartate 1-decarboxylase [Clostridiales bacterium]